MNHVINIDFIGGTKVVGAIPLVFSLQVAEIVICCLAEDRINVELSKRYFQPKWLARKVGNLNSVSFIEQILEQSLNSQAKNNNSAPWII